MVEDLLQDISEMDETEFKQFKRYYIEMKNDFMTQRYPGEGLEEAIKNIEKLEDRGGNAIVLGELDGLFRRADSPEQYSEVVRSYIENSDYAEKIENTMEEVVRPFFDEEENLEYSI